RDARRRALRGERAQRLERMALIGRAVIDGRHEMAVEVDEAHRVARWPRYHATVAASPSSNGVVARHPNRSRARVVSSARRGWPFGFVTSHPMRPVKPTAFATVVARSLMLTSCPLPRLTGSASSYSSV